MSEILKVLNRKVELKSENINLSKIDDLLLAVDQTNSQYNSAFDSGAAGKKLLQDSEKEFKKGISLANKGLKAADSLTNTARELGVELPNNADKAITNLFKWKGEMEDTLGAIRSAISKI